MFQALGDILHETIALQLLHLRPSSRNVWNSETGVVDKVQVDIVDTELTKRRQGDAV